MGDNAFAKVKGSDKGFHLLNSINMPVTNEAENMWLLLSKPFHKHCFALEFEKIPAGTVFNIVDPEQDNSKFNMKGLHADTSVIGQKIDIDRFIADSPLKEMGEYYKDGEKLRYVNAKGVLITVKASNTSNYGNYITVNFSLQNYGSRTILLDPDKISATGKIYKQKKGVKRKCIGRDIRTSAPIYAALAPDEIERTDTIPLTILTAEKYDKKVARKQAASAFFVGLVSGLTAAAAGYSSSTTNYYSSSYTTGHGALRRHSHSTTFGQAHTSTYNAGAALMAQQQAVNNTVAYANGQQYVREQLYADYVKKNTIHSQVEVSGFFNIQLRSVDQLDVEFLVNGESYPFSWKMF